MHIEIVKVKTARKTVRIQVLKKMAICTLQNNLIRITRNKVANMSNKVKDEVAIARTVKIARFIATSANPETIFKK